jgi:aminoglycoside 6'-N-acetyltransferase I
MPFRIAPLTDADETDWLRMRHALWPDASEAEHARDRPMMMAEDALVLIARNETGEAVGFAELSTRPHANGCASSPVAYLEGIWVDSAIRGTGVGRELVAAAEVWARRRGYTEMASDALLDNHGSISAHKAWGFDNIMQIACFRKAVDGAGPAGAA